MSKENEIKMILFARWLATCYADTHVDSHKRSQHDEGFDESSALSVLNRETGEWYQDRLKHFNEKVYPNYVENGTVQNMIIHLESQKNFSEALKEGPTKSNVKGGMPGHRNAPPPPPPKRVIREGENPPKPKQKQEKSVEDIVKKLRDDLERGESRWTQEYEDADRQSQAEMEGYQWALNDVIIENRG